MRMRCLWIALFLGACANQASSDLQYVKQARSLAAEWALVNQQAQAGALTPAYVRSMHYWLNENLRTASSSLSQPNSRYGAEIRSLLAEPANASPDRLRAHARTLKQIEGGLESA